MDFWIKFSIFVLVSTITPLRAEDKWSWKTTNDKKGKSIDSGSPSIASIPLEPHTVSHPIPQELNNLNDTDPRFLDFKPKLCKLGLKSFCPTSHLDSASSYSTYQPVHNQVISGQHTNLNPHGFELPSPTIVHHEHIHTHIHQNNPSHTIIPTHNPALDESPFLNQPPLIPSRPIQANHIPAVAPVSSFPNPTLLKPSTQGLVYAEKCQCVPRHYCDPRDVVPSRNPTDFSHLISPRTRQTNVTSTANAVNSTQTHNSTVEDVSRSKRDTLEVKSRQVSVCRSDLICCRRPFIESTQGREERQCGRGGSAVHGRITKNKFNSGGTSFGQYPWQVAVLKRTQNRHLEFVCGGVLIDDIHILTAAHCVHGINAGSLVILLGEWDASKETEFYKSIEEVSSRVFIHPNYDGGNLANDIAVIRMRNRIPLNKFPHISPVCLPPPRSDFTHQRCTVTGWGKDAFNDHGRFQDVLKQVQVPIVDRQLCERALQHARLGADFRLHHGMICAGGEKDKDACKGDGGGPLVCKSRDGAYELAGLVSWGIGCGGIGVPGVYVNIPFYVDFIRASTHAP